MSSKTVKITNGKILNYKISAPNYKTIYGSKLITADETINKNMIAEESADGVYTIGDRIGNIATFFTYYTDGNGNKYAVFVLDAKYRSENALAWGTGDVASGLTPYPSNIGLTTETVCVDSATANTDYIINTNPSYRSFKFCNDILLPSLNISAKLPNPFELNTIRLNGNILDTYDPTITDYSARALSNWRISWTCYERDNANAWNITSSGIGYYRKSSDPCYVIPVFEIPVE